MAATSISSRFLAYEIAVPISQPEKTLEFQNYKLIFFFSLSIFTSYSLSMLSMNSAHSRQRTPYNLKKTELLIPEASP